MPSHTPHNIFRISGTIHGQLCMNGTITKLNVRGDKKRIAQNARRERTVRILKMVALGVLIIGIGAAPSPKAVGKVLRGLFLDDTSQNRRYAQRKIREMKNRGLLQRHGVRYSVSDKGKRVLSLGQILNLSIPKPDRWSGKWYLVMFDIPLSQSHERRMLNSILFRMGLEPYQQSVLVYPHPVKETILEVCRFYKIIRYVSFATADTLDGSDTLKKLFKLT